MNLPPALKSHLVLQSDQIGSYQYIRSVERQLAESDYGE